MTIQDDVDPEFESLSQLVTNLRTILPPLTHVQNQLVGLYLLQAFYLGKGEKFTTMPVVVECPSTSDKSPRANFTVINGDKT